MTTCSSMALTSLAVPPTPALSPAAAAAAAATPYLRRTTVLPRPSQPPSTTTRGVGRLNSISCQVALKSEFDSELFTEEESADLKSKLDKVGSKVRLKSALKVYHVPKVPEVELPAGTEGVVKQYVGFWKGKRISANFPFKIEFLIDTESRGPVKFFAHLREDEFEFV